MFSTSKSFFRKPSAGGTTDASFAYVPLLTETGSTSSRSTTVSDGALTPNTVTRNGTVSTGWTSPYQTDGYWSNQFNGTNAYLSVPNNAAFELGANNFTIEAWIQTTSSVQFTSIAAKQTSSATGNWWFLINNASATAGDVAFWCYDYNAFSVAMVVTTGASVRDGAWHHVALVRNSSTWTIYIDGVSRGTQTSSVTIGTLSAAVYVGNNQQNNTKYFPGYISNFRFVNGVAVYTTAFTPSTTPLTATQSANVNGNPSAAITGTATSLLTCQSNRFIDNSSNPKTITVNGTPSVQSGYYPFAAPTASPGAALLNGTNQYLSVPNNAVFNMGGADFTIECWYYPLVSTPSGSIYSKRATTAVYGNVQLGFGGALTPQVLATFDNASWGIFITSSIACVLNSWNHIALSRSGSSWRLFVNGSLGASTTSSSSVATNSIAVSIGAAAADGGGVLANGYISNFRFVNGNAVYTSAFTLPTAPLAATQSANSNGNPSAAITGTQTSLLLGLADSNYTSASSGGTNNTFIDDSTNAFTVTRNGTPTQGSRTPYWPNGQWSNYFVASSSQTLLTTQTQVIPTGNFTIECWAYVTSSTATQAFVSQGTSGSAGRTAIGIDNSSGAKWFCQVGGVFVYSSVAPTLNTWNYLAMTYDGIYISLYLNGALLNFANNTTSAQNSQLRISGLWATPVAGYYLDGYLSNVRVSNTVRSVSSIPTAPFTSDANTTLLTCQSNRFIDNSSSPKTLTPSGTPSVQAFQPFSPAASYSAATYAGSGYFNGSTDYLTAAGSPVIGTNDFTIEGWVYTSTYASFIAFIDFRAASTNGVYPYIYINTDGTVRFYVSTAERITGATAISLNAWNHIAVSRTSSVTKLFLNGVQQGSNYSDTNSYLCGASRPAISSSGFTLGSGLLNGYISNLRVVNGVGIYPNAFTPPTTPVTNTAQTSLLLNMANAGIYDAAAQNNATTFGNAQVSTAVTPKWPPSSMRFNGSPDYLLTPIPSLNAAFTIEFWFYRNGTGNNYPFTIGDENASTGLSVLIGSAGTTCIIYSNNAVQITSSTVPATSVWTYIAITRNSSNVVRLYINGTQVGGTWTTSATFANILRVGAEFFNGSVIQYCNGYIQDFRITNGVARTITTPTAAFPTR